MKIRDFIDDKLWQAAYLPNDTFDKMASVSRETVMGLPSDQYGGVFVDEQGHAQGRFPMNTADNTAMSAGYLLHGDHNLTKQASAIIAKRLHEGFFRFSLPVPDPIAKLAADAGDIEAVQIAAECEAHPNPHVKEAQYFEKYAYTLNINGEQHFPIYSKDSAKLACVWFENNMSEIPFELRREVAKSFDKHASVYEVPVGELAGAYLGEERSFLFKSAMQARAAVVPEFKERYNALLEDDSPLEEIAVKLAEIDMDSQVNVFWDAAISDPWATTYQNNIKLAESKYECTFGGETITGEDLLRITNFRPKYIEDVLGRNLGQEFLTNPIKFFDKAEPTMKRVLTNLAKDVREESR